MSIRRKPVVNNAERRADFESRARWATLRLRRVQTQKLLQDLGRDKAKALVGRQPST